MYNRKIDRFKNNPENLLTMKVNKHIPSASLMCTISSFRSLKNVYKSKDFIKKFCEYFREHAMKIIQF